MTDSDSVDDGDDCNVGAALPTMIRNITAIVIMTTNCVSDVRLESSSLRPKRLRTFSVLEAPQLISCNHYDCRQVYYYYQCVITRRTATTAIQQPPTSNKSSASVLIRLIVVCMNRVAITIAIAVSQQMHSHPSHPSLISSTPAAMGFALLCLHLLCLPYL